MDFHGHPWTSMDFDGRMNPYELDDAMHEMHLMKLERYHDIHARQGNR